jgi:hypothetical protein
VKEILFFLLLFISMAGVVFSSTLIASGLLRADRDMFLALIGYYEDIKSRKTP